MNQGIITRKKEQQLAILKESPMEYLNQIDNLRNIVDFNNIYQKNSIFLLKKDDKKFLFAILVKLITNFNNYFNCERKLDDFMIDEIAKELINNNLYNFFSIESIAYALGQMKRGNGISFKVFNYLDVNTVLSGLRDELYYIVEYEENNKISQIKEECMKIKKLLKNESK